MRLNKYIIILVVALSNLSFQQVGFSIGLNTIGTHNVIGLSYKRDCILSFSSIVPSNYLQIDIQAAIAYHDFLAVQVGYKNSLNLGKFGEHFSNHFINISAGVFHTILLKNSKLYHKKGKWDNRFKRRHFLVDAYMAYGKGVNKTFLYKITYTDNSTINSNSIKNKFFFNKLYLQTGAHYHGNIFGLSLTGLLGILQFNKVMLYGNNRLGDIDNLIQTFEEENYYLTSGYTIKAYLSFHRFKLVYCAHRDYILGSDNLNDYLINKVRQLKIQVNMYNLFKRK